MRPYRALTDSHDWSPEMADDRNQISYPLDNRWYTMKYPAAYLSTRTHGVFSSDVDLICTPAGGLKVNLSPGLAWLRIERFKGTVFANLKDIEIPITIPHPVNTRIDRIVIRYDVLLGDIFPAIYDGVPSNNPQPIELERNENGIEIGIWDIRVPPGTLEITAEHITDIRLNEALCGVMRDGVTGIPTQQLIDAWWVFFGRAQSDATAEYNKFVEWLNDYKVSIIDDIGTWKDETTTDVTEWIETIKDILDEEAASRLLLMIQKLESRVPSENIGSVTYSAKRFPVCTLYSTTDAAGLANAGMTNAGGGSLKSIPADFEISGETINVKTIAEYANNTTVIQIVENMFAFIATDSNKSLVLTLN